MAKWIELGPESDFPAGVKKSVTIQGTPVTVFNIEGLLLAIVNSCPHAGLPLGEGELCGKTITCPFHGYAYNVETGRNVDFPDSEQPVRTVPARIENGKVEVDLEACTM
ncbi:MAG: Rieske (2Fe-2S) protein [Planctomycetes bacterium]|nr:Rieske (2Fe-2S) protein [Planctomycetota bacterium]